MADWELLGVPIYTLASYHGMGDAPAALRKGRLAAALGAQKDLGDVALAPLKKDLLEGRTKNLTSFRVSTAKIRDAASSLDSPHLLLLGGECSETVGAMSGLSSSFGGKPGMLWMDAHGDFNTPETSASGYIGGMCLAMACGRAKVDVGLGVGSPLAEERLVHVGSRALDQPEIEAFNSSPVKLYTSRHVKSEGAAGVAEEAAKHLDNMSDWIACHLDVDVVYPTSIPAVNYPTPGGLTVHETAEIVRAVWRTGKMRLLEVTAFNPSKGGAAASAKVLADLVALIVG